MGNKERLVLIDGHAMLYRAFFAFPQTLTTREGMLINAVYGFTRILLTVIETFHPEYLVVSFDVGKTFRHEMYKEYKAHREKMPEELKAQEPLVDRVLNAMNVPVVAKEGYEADDVIGTLAFQASVQAPSTKFQETNNNQLPNSNDQTDRQKMQQLLETVIVTGDRDVLQLVSDPGVKVYMPARINKPGIIYDEAAVKEDLGVTPKQIPDYKGLAGDSSDNIPGVRGVGPKTAVALLTKYQTVEGVYEHTHELSGSVKQKIEAGKEMAFKSRELAMIVRDVPVKLDLEMAKVKSFDKTRVVTVFTELEFTSLLSKLPKDEFEEEVQEALF